MQYEDLKDVFYFKSACGESKETFKACKVSKHTWDISCDSNGHSSVWDYSDFLDYLNKGSWVIQGEEDTSNPAEQEPREDATDVKTLRDKFAMVALQGWIAGRPAIAEQPLDGTVEHAKLIAEVAYRYADAMIAERNKKGQSIDKNKT